MIAASGYALAPQKQASAASVVTADPNKVYISMKNADFGSGNPLASGTPSWTSVTSPPSGMLQMGSESLGALQYNYGVTSSGSKYSSSDLQTPGGTVGFQQVNSRNLVRLTTTKNYTFGSMFNQERVTLSNNRSFSTYFSFKMSGGSQADGIVFALQTASNEAGSSGGGLGYSGVAKSFGIEYDTYYNTGKDGDGTARNDPPPVEGVTGNRSSHVAVDLDGDVGHASQSEGQNIATLDIARMSLAKTSSETTSDPYDSFHTWIDYDGSSQQLRVYLIRQNTDGTYYAPVVGSDGKLVTTGSGASKQISTVQLTAFPTLSGGSLVAPTSGGSFTIKPIISEKVDLSSHLLQDDVFAGFTAATGGANQNHDIYSWYFNNYSGLIVPGTDSQGQPTVVQAPTAIAIEKSPMSHEGQNVQFKNSKAGQPYGTEPAYGGASTLDGIVADGSSAEVKAAVTTADGSTIAGYPVTFSLYYVSGYTSVNIGSGRTVSTAVQDDDDALYLTAQGYAVHTSHYTRNGQEVTVREITVPTDASGVATVNVWNLGDYPHLTNVKARIGGELDGKVYGGGGSDTAPILFADAVVPKVTSASVGQDRHTVDVTLDTPVDYDPASTGGFTLNIDDGNGGTLNVPLKITGHAKDGQGEDDPFRLELEIDPNAPGYPPSLPSDYVIPPNTPPKLSYDAAHGSVKGTGENGLPLASFPDPDDQTAGTPIQNRFAPIGQTVVNDADRNKIEVQFPGDIEDPSAALSAFSVTVNSTGTPADWTPVAVERNPDDASKLTIVGSSPIPAGAKVALSYDPSQLSAGSRIVEKASQAELDAFANDPVANQVQPVQAFVVDDQSRDKVKVKFANPLNAASLTDAAAAFTFDIDNVGSVSAVGASLDGSDPSGKTLILALDPAALAGTNGIPLRPENATATNITMNYSAGLNGIDVREAGADGRSLAWLHQFEVNNQPALVPEAAAVAKNPSTGDRDQIIVKFPDAVTLTGNPTIQAIIDTGIGQPQVVDTVPSVTGSDTLTLPLPGGVTVPPNASVKLSYVPQPGSGIASQTNSLLWLQSLDSFPADNVYVAIDGLSVSGSVYQVTGRFEPGSTLAVQVYDANGSPVEGSVQEDGSGWNWIPAVPLAPGAYTVDATAQGLLGTSDSDEYSFTRAVMPASAEDGNVSTATQRPIHGVLPVENPDGLPLTFAVGSQPASGTLTVDPNTGSYTYQPNAEFIGDDEFTFSVTDSQGHTTNGTMYITVTAADMVYNVRLTAEPDRVLADGHSTTVLKAVVTDQQGLPVSDVPVQFSVPGAYGQFIDEDGNELGSSVIATTYEGASIRFRPAQLLGQTSPVNIEVKASVNDPDLGLQGQARLSLWLDPAILSGVIVHTNPLTGASEPAAGVEVKIWDEDGHFVGSAWTDDNGKYSFPISQGEKTYWAEIQETVGSGANAQTVTYRQRANIGAAIDGSGQQFVSDQTLTGIIGAPDEHGAFQPIRFGEVGTPSGDMGGSPEFRAYLKKADGTYVDNSGYSLSGNGVFAANGLPNDPSIAYELEIRYYYDVKKPDGTVDRDYVIVNRKADGTFPALSVNQQGEMRIFQQLIDPFGTVTDAATGLPLQGAKVVLTYADTQRNRDKGIVPGTEVALPSLPGFAPNDNANPQFSDAAGSYAFMVFGDTDYLITATLNGYVTYRSGIIQVNSDIVHWNIPMTRISASVPSTPQPPAPPEPPKDASANVTVNVAVKQSTYEENHAADVVVTYRNEGGETLGSGRVTLTLPERSVVLDAAGGTVSGNAITWDVKDLAAGQKIVKTVRIQFPSIDDSGKTVELRADFASDAPSVHPENASASAKVLVFSNRYGDIGHDRYILGYPDDSFKPQRSLTRAELAAIIARLINGGHTDLRASYTDVPQGHWASGYIRIASDNGIFTGYEDGSFRPDQAITREELAAVMARFLQLETPAAVDSHFNDTAGRWSTSAVEALFRNGMIQGYEDGTFHPAQPITRMEAVALINRMLFRGPLGNVSPSFPDVPKTSWGFGDVEEATTSHDASRNSDGSETFAKPHADQVK